MAVSLPSREIATLYIRGARITELARMYGVSDGTIKKRLLAECVILRTHAQSAKALTGKPRQSRWLGIGR